MNARPDSSDLIFAPGASFEFGAGVARALGTDLAPLEEREFDGGEHKIRPLTEVRGQRCWIVQSLRGETTASANDRLCRTLFLVGALRDAGAVEITVCLPYLAYARKERRTKPRDPVLTRYVAQLLEAVGTTRVIALEVHDPAAFDNAFRCEAVSLTFAPLLAARLARQNVSRLVVMSPDIGGVKRAQLMAELLEDRLDSEVGLAFVEKRRSEGTVSGGALVGDVAGRCVLIVDDLIASGGTAMRAVAACRAAGAARVVVAACHPVFTREASQLLGPQGPDALVVTNSVLLPRLWPASPRLEVLDATGLVADAIGRLQRGEALGDLTGPRDRVR